MAETAIGLNGLQTLDVTADFAAKVTFAFVASFNNIVDDFVELFFRKLVGAERRVDPESVHDFRGTGRADAIDIAQREFDAFVIRNVYTK